MFKVTQPLRSTASPRALTPEPELLAPFSRSGSQAEEDRAKWGGEERHESGMGVTRSRVRRTMRIKLRQSPMQRKWECSERRLFPCGCHDVEGPGQLWEMTLGQGVSRTDYGVRERGLEKKKNKH